MLAFSSMGLGGGVYEMQLLGEYLYQQGLTVKSHSVSRT